MSRPTPRLPIVMRGWLGWGNRKAGLEAYGPEGRWGGGEHGDLLGDAFDRHGAYEGCDLLVVALPRFTDDETMTDLEALVAERLGVDVIPMNES